MLHLFLLSVEEEEFNFPIDVFDAILLKKMRRNIKTCI